MFLTVGCVRYDYQLITSLDKEKFTFYAGYHLVASSEKDENEFVTELLEQELKKNRLCPDGYIIDRKSYSRHSDPLWDLHCK